MARIALSEMIEELRKELQIAVEAGEGEDIRFGVGELTLEAQVEVSKEGGAEGGVKFWVAEIGASGKVGKVDTQKIVLKLEPVDEDGLPLKVGRYGG
jgi:translation elongation factor EF-1beta